MHRIFVLQPYGGVANFNFVVITPEPTEPAKVTSAWSYAVRYTAKGLDLPDHEAALNLLKERHPSWEIIQSFAYPIGMNLSIADKDVAEQA